MTAERGFSELVIAVTERQLADMLFAWTVVRHVRSNAIVLTSQSQSVGIGAGQMSRVDAAKVGWRVAAAAVAAAMSLQSTRFAEFFATSHTPPRLGSAAGTTAPALCRSRTPHDAHGFRSRSLPA